MRFVDGIADGLFRLAVLLVLLVLLQCIGGMRREGVAMVAFL